MHTTNKLKRALVDAVEKDKIRTHLPGLSHIQFSVPAPPTRTQLQRSGLSSHWILLPGTYLNGICERVFWNRRALSAVEMISRTCSSMIQMKASKFITPETDFRAKWLYPDLLAQVYIHASASYGIYRAFTTAKLLTSLWCLFVIYTSGIGITAGVHRLWSHRSYKARWQLRLLLALLFTVTGQLDIYTWARDHRIHHKYSETNADPHNAKRGFWFSHVGWLVMTPHPDVVTRRSQIKMDDLDADPIVKWQRRLFIPLFTLLCVAGPVLVPYYFWSEGFIDSLFVSFNLRFAITLNIAYSVNSFAHMYGAKPFDKNISPSENMGVAVTSLGEGWHNYHHVFPWDYKASEIGQCLNPTTIFIDFMARLGWAYNLRFANAAAVLSRAHRTGDGSKYKGSESSAMPKQRNVAGLTMV